jgi:hypothetical protein
LREKTEKKREGTRPHDRYRKVWYGNIKIDHGVIIFEIVYCNNIAGDWNNWWAVAYTEMNIQFPYFC